MAEYIVDARPSDLFGIKMTGLIVRCKDCRYAILTYSGECKYCKKRMDDDGGMEQLYLPGDWYCADGERKDGETG